MKLRSQWMAAAAGWLKGRPAVESPPMRVWNQTRQQGIGDRIELAGSGERRRKGLLGRTGLAAGEGLWIVPCEAVHTFGMQFAIDVIFLDRRLRVLKVRHAMGKWRIAGCLTAHSVLELPAGHARATGTRCGDQLEISP